MPSSTLIQTTTASLHVYSTFIIHSACNPSVENTKSELAIAQLNNLETNTNTVFKNLHFILVPFTVYRPAVPDCWRILQHKIDHQCAGGIVKCSGCEECPGQVQTRFRQPRVYFVADEQTDKPGRTRAAFRTVLSPNASLPVRHCFQWKDDYPSCRWEAPSGVWRKSGCTDWTVRHRQLQIAASPRHSLHLEKRKIIFNLYTCIPLLYTLRWIEQSSAYDVLLFVPLVFVRSPTYIAKRGFQGAAIFILSCFVNCGIYFNVSTDFVFIHQQFVCTKGK
jgi:hypothetical protein